MSGWSPAVPRSSAAGEPGHGVADLEGALAAFLGGHGARPDPADVAVAGQAVGGSPSSRASR